MVKHPKKKGFTLIELIVVIAILGILAAVAIPRLGGFTDKAKTQADTATAKMIATGVTSLLADGTWVLVNATVVTVTNDCAAVSFTAAGDITTTGTFATDLSKLVGTKITAQTGTKTGFKITIDANGNVTSAVGY